MSGEFRCNQGNDEFGLTVGKEGKESGRCGIQKDRAFLLAKLLEYAQAVIPENE